MGESKYKSSGSGATASQNASTLVWDFGSGMFAGAVGNSGMTNWKRSGALLIFDTQILSYALPPVGSVILNAYIRHPCKNETTTPGCHARYRGWKNFGGASPATFAEYQARRGTDIGGANNDYITTAVVTWDNLPAACGCWNVHPDLSTIIQELIELPGYDPDTSAIGIFFDDHDERSSYGGMRNYDNTMPLDYCELNITYTASTLAVRTDPATDITTTSAVLNGTLLDDGV